MPYIGIGINTANSKSRYWTQSKINEFCLFFASDNTSILNKVASTQLPNQVTGSTDYLTVTDSGLDARYRTPDTAAYRAADSGYVFWKSDASESICDGNRLIGYDFPRILVKYLDVAPYTIQWIAILKVGVTVTNGMRDAFDLSIWWDNTLSAYGNLKGNRGVGQSVWTPESVYCAEYQAVYNAFVSKPSAADGTIQNTMLKALVDGGYYAKADLIDIFSAHANAESLFNWKNPAALNPALVNAPAWTQYAGYTGNSAGGKYVRLNYIPSSSATNFSRNSACAIIGVGDDALGTVWDFGANDGTNYTGIISRYTGDLNYFALNDAAGGATTANTNSKKHYAISRGNSINFDSYQNLVKTTKTTNSVALGTREFYACGWNQNGTPEINNKTIRYVLLFSYLTEAEVQAVIGIMEAYLDNYGTGLY